MTHSFLALRRLRIMQRGHAVYDELFHDGVNIIRGANGSGKSTISDFIFYILGGEFDDWKDSAKQCDEVQAEIETQNAFLTLRRSIASKQEPISIYFGSFLQAKSSPLEGWQKLSIRRHGLDLSFSQVLFRCCGIPEAVSQQSSNITAHQILRLLYADQRTPAPRLFRFESFDTQDIRTAVSDLLAGVNGYELYDVQIALRSFKAQYDDTKKEYEALFKALPSKEGLINTVMLEQSIADLSSERVRLVNEIENVNDRIEDNELKDFISEKRVVSGTLRILSGKLDKSQDALHRLSDEVEDLENFMTYLSEIYSKLKATSRSSTLLGEIEFSFCPSCLKPLHEHVDVDRCIVCSQPLDHEEERSRYASIIYDTELQLRETKQLISMKNEAVIDLKRIIREMNEQYKSGVSSYISRFDSGNSPRERYLADRNLRLGEISSEIRRVESLMEVAARIDELDKKRQKLNTEIDLLQARENVLRAATGRRHSAVASMTSEIATEILRNDIPRQEEFISCKNVELLYRDDAITVDGKMNFAESSNVVAKNTAILALFSAACLDDAMWHPRFVVFDNVEDKGMEPERSHRFQNIIIERSQAAIFRHQIIFTTSMIDPEIDNSAFCVGEKYSRENRSLKLA